MKYIKFNSVTTITNGFPCKKELYSYDNSNIPIIRIQNMNNDENDFIFYSGDYDSSSIVKKGDLLLSLSGTIKPYIWNKEGEYLLNQRIIKIETNNNTINKKYLYYFLLYNINDIISKGNKAIINNVSINVIKNLDIPIIDIQEQYKIVEKLDKICELKNNKMNSNNELYNYRYSKYKEFIDNVDYSLQPLSNYCHEIMKGPFGSDIKKSLYVQKTSDAYKVYIQKNILQHDESIGDYYISNDYFINKMSKYELLPNDYIVTCDGTLGKILQLSNNMEKGIISASLLKIRLKNDIIDNKFFEATWEYDILPNLTRDIRNACLNHLPSAKIIGQYNIKIPSYNHQTVFGRVLNNIDSLIDNNNNSIIEIDNLFNSFMQEYFSK